MKSAMASDPLFFCRTVAPGLFKVPFGTFHRSLADDVINPKTQMTVIAIARKHGKSTFIDVGVVLWLILHRNVQFVIIASATQDLSKKFLGHIKSVVKSPHFVKYYGDITQINRGDGDKWTDDTINLRGKFGDYILHARIDAMGAGQAMPGQNVSLLDKNGVPQAIRPQIIIGDDLEDQKSVLNPENADKLESWANQAVLPALHDNKSRYFVIGTPYANDCYLTRSMGYEVGVTVIKYPFIIEGKDQEKLARKLGLEIGTPLWPEFYSQDEVQKKRDFYHGIGDIRSFRLQYQLDTRAGSVWGFDRDDIEAARFSMNEIRDSQLNWYMTVDFAYSTKKHSDRSAIVLCAWDERGHIYVVYAKQGQWGDVNTAKMIGEVAATYGPLMKDTLPIYIETQSYGATKELVVRVMNELSVPYMVGRLEPHNIPKENRIKPLIPITQSRRLHLPADGTARELERQMWGFDGLPKAKGDDLLDALAYQLTKGMAADEKKVVGLESEENRAAWERTCGMFASGAGAKAFGFGDNWPPRIRRTALGSGGAECF